MTNRLPARTGSSGRACHANGVASSLFPAWLRSQTRLTTVVGQAGLTTVVGQTISTFTGTDCFAIARNDDRF